MALFGVRRRRSVEGAAVVLRAVDDHLLVAMGSTATDGSFCLLRALEHLEQRGVGVCLSEVDRREFLDVDRRDLVHRSTACEFGGLGSTLNGGTGGTSRTEEMPSAVA